MYYIDKLNDIIVSAASKREALDYMRDRFSTAYGYAEGEFSRRNVKLDRVSVSVADAVRDSMIDWAD